MIRLVDILTFLRPMLSYVPHLPNCEALTVCPDLEQRCLLCR